MNEARFGTLVVVVDKARNLPNRKKIGKQDAYAIVRLGHDVQRTPTDKRAGQVPNWNHEIRFKVSHETENILKLSVFNEDSKTPDLIGDCAIDLTDLYKNHEFDSWFDLKYKDKPAGELYAELTFYYEGPPKPRPKVELGEIDSMRDMSRSRDGTGMPNLPIMSSEFRAPSRQATSSAYDERATVNKVMPGVTETLFSSSVLQNDPRSALAGYTHQMPYAVNQYAETWDGMRSDALATPAPGDVRRKSFSAAGSRSVTEQERLYQVLPLSQTSAQDSYVNGFGSPDPEFKGRRYSQGELAIHRDRRHDHNSLQNHIDYGDRRGSRPVQTQQYLPSHGYRALPLPDLQQNHRIAPRGYHMDDEVRFVEPILDPRHGSPSELRNSPRLISPHPEYASGYKQSPVLEQEEFDFDPRNVKSQQEQQQQPQHQQGQIHTNFVQNRTHPQNKQDFVAQSGQRPTSLVNAKTGRTQRHEQSQSVAYGSSRLDTLSPGASWPRPLPSHAKAASTSWTADESRGRAWDAHLEPGHMSAVPEVHSFMPDYAQDLNYQRRTTYASTPAQYSAQNRPLPSEPNAPPELPAKVPLGLTREEYDILYGR